MSPRGSCHAADDRQLRQLHLQPRPVPGRARRRRAGVSQRRDHARQVAALAPAQIVVSPGPCTPSEAGISVPLIQRFAGQIPILGVCLGHQAIGQAFGGRIVRAQRVMHGKLSPVTHDGRGVFSGRADAVRRHAVPFAGHRARARAGGARGDGNRRRWRDHGRAPSASCAVEGVQFHPEAILTEHGKRMLGEFSGGPAMKSMARIVVACACALAAAVGQRRRARRMHDQGRPRGGDALPRRRRQRGAGRAEQGRRRGRQARARHRHGHRPPRRRRGAGQVDARVRRLPQGAVRLREGDVCERQPAPSRGCSAAWST